MMITVFRSRVRPENAEEYMKMAAKMSELAQAMPRYVSHKGFTAEDGERVTIVECKMLKSSAFTFSGDSRRRS